MIWANGITCHIKFNSAFDSRFAWTKHFQNHPIYQHWWLGDEDNKLFIYIDVVFLFCYCVASKWQLVYLANFPLIEMFFGGAFFRSGVFAELFPSHSNVLQLHNMQISINNKLISFLFSQNRWTLRDSGNNLSKNYQPLRFVFRFYQRIEEEHDLFFMSFKLAPIGTVPVVEKRHINNWVI